MPWWMWVVGGLVLFILEVWTPTGFFLTFLGIGAILVGALARIGAVESDWMQWLLFSMLSVAAVVTLRRPLRERLLSKDNTSKIEGLIGEVVMPTQDIGGGAFGQAECRGTSWSARNVQETPLARGQRCRVDRVEGLTLYIRAE
jgi:membrane protein implicated in regulation of membrane protease activity